MLCITAHIVRRHSQPSPGGVVTYSVWVWSTVRARRVTASMAANLRETRLPHFTLCPTAHRKSCSIGSLPADQALELMITDRVRAKATPGHQITLTVTLTAANLSPAVAAITTMVGQPSASPVPTAPGALPPSLFPVFPSTTISPDSLSNLFPVVTPSPSVTSSAGRASRQSRKLAGVTSSSVPLDPRQIGGQLAGLAVLAAAIAMVVARLSLRSAQPAAGTTASPAAAGPASPAGPAGPAPAAGTAAAAAGAAVSEGTAGDAGTASDTGTAAGAADDPAADPALGDPGAGNPATAGDPGAVGTAGLASATGQPSPAADGVPTPQSPA